MSKIISKEKAKKAKETLERLETPNYSLSHNEVKKIFTFSKILSGDEKGLIFEKLFYEDKKIALGVVNKMLDFSLKEKIPISGVFDVLINLEIAHIKLLYKLFMNPKLTKLERPNGMEEPVENEIRTALYVQMEEVCNYGNTIPHFGKRINPDAFQEILNNSYEEIQKQILSKTKKINLPLTQYAINSDEVIKELGDEQYRFNNIFTNKKSLSQINQGNHFLSYLLKDEIEITEDYNVVFKGHTKALSIGYTDKAILLSIDKDIAIRELQTKIKHLQDYRTEESENLITYTNHLIDFIKQKRNAKIIPFKALSKEVGITKNQAKNYAKKLLSINDKTFTDNFEDIKLLDK